MTCNTWRPSRSHTLLLGAMVTMLALGTASAQLGTTNSPYSSSKAKAVSHGPQQGVSPFKTYNNAEYATGGVGLRNQSQRSIIISGLPAGSVAQDAYLYWVFLLNTNTPPPAVTSMKLARTFPVPANATSVTLNGTLVGTGADPCWGSVGAYVYRAQVPVSLASGNGNYMVTLLPGAGGLTDGEDPWDENVVFQLAEGASLVIITSNGSHTVSIYDSGIAGLTSISSDVEYVLNLPAAASGGQMLWDTIGSDGQTGASRTDNAASLETTTINGFPVAGADIGAGNPDSDWNGSAAFPLPELWDDKGHDITGAAPGGTTSLDVLFTSQFDCFNVVANVVAQ